MTRDERLALFQRELSYIKDEKIKEFAENLLADADEYFFTVPASSSGKYHPDFARGEGGLVRHTKAVVYFTTDFCRSEFEFKTINARQAQLLIVAAIAHDIKKQGDGSTGHTMMKEHPYLAAEYVKAENEKYQLLSDEDVDYIYKAVRSHMGPWCDVKPETRAELTLFYADYTASRSEIAGLKFLESDCGELPTPEPLEEAPKLTIDGYRFNFSKMKGLTLKEAYEKDAGFLNWIANKEGFGNVEVQNLVKEFLKTV